MRLVRVQVTRKGDRFKIMGHYRSASGRRIRKSLGVDVKKSELQQLLQVANEIPDNR